MRRLTLRNKARQGGAYILKPLTAAASSFFFRFDYLFAVVVAAFRAHVVAETCLAAVRTQYRLRRREAVVASAVTPPRT